MNMEYDFIGNRIVPPSSNAQADMKRNYEKPKNISLRAFLATQPVVTHTDELIALHQRKLELLIKHARGVKEHLAKIHDNEWYKNPHCDPELFAIAMVAVMAKRKQSIKNIKDSELCLTAGKN